MRVAIIDADLIGRKRHRFPNLASMKLSAYCKDLGDEVELKTDYENLDDYDRVFISKVFTDTPVPDGIIERKNVIHGGTGFYYDLAPKLPADIEHMMPDYHLYDDWVEEQIKSGKPRKEFTYYLDYSIGFRTRGCFRKCAFCVNKNYDRVERHSELSEFFDKDRKKICLLDDNFLGHPQWKEMLLELQDTGRRFQFKQGLDERLLTEEKCELLFRSNYDGDYIFAFDNLADQALIINKLDIIRKFTNKIPKFYCFCGYDRNDRWDTAFWVQDIIDLFKRIEILMHYRCLPYVMRYNRYKESPWSAVYTQIARWCNQPAFFKKKTLREFMEAHGADSMCNRILRVFEDTHPEASKYYDMRFGS